MKRQTQKLTLGAMFLALGILLPFLTGQIPQVGRMLLPMHLPVFLCALICGWQYALPVGAILPLLRTVLFGKPAPYPDAIAIACELAVYGLVAGLLYPALRKKGWAGLYATLISTMIAGRLARGIVQLALLEIKGQAFGARAFFGGIVLAGLPGIVLQLILIPLIMRIYERHGKRAYVREEDLYLPDALRSQLALTDWSRRNVLVGSTGSEAQLAKNLSENFYYVPLKYLPSADLPIEYVAVYQGSFYREPGIRYYARVQTKRVVKRGEIPIPLRRKNGDEDYLLFEVEGWQTLPHPIDIQTEAVTAPRLTNELLLRSAEQTYELFALESERDFLLLRALRQMAHRLEEGYPSYTVRINEEYALVGKGRTVRLQKNRETLFRFSLTQLKKDPKSMFVVLKHKM